MASIESAIDSLIRADLVDLGFAFAEKFKHHELALKILTTHTKNSAKALKYLKKLSVEHQLSHMKKFGRDFLENEEESTVELLIEIINHPNVILTTSGHESETDLDTWEEIEEPDKQMVVNIDRIVEIIDHKPDILVRVCEFCTQLEKAEKLGTIWRCLLEIELKNWSLDRSAQNEKKIINLLKTNKMDEEAGLGLVLCRQYNFQPGLIYILGNKTGSNSNLSDLLFLYLESGMNTEALALCEKHGKVNPDFWRKTLTSWALR